VRLPSGLTSPTTTSSTVSYVNDNEAFGVASESVVVTVNGRAFETTWDAASRTWTSRTPAGRVSRVVVDEKERPLRLESPDDAPVTMTYAPDGGQLASVTQGTRTSTFAYGPNGLVSRATDALQRPTAYTYSTTQRVDSVTAPTTEVTRLGFDGRGRLTGVTPPDAGTHLSGYTPAGQLASYAPPPLVSVAPESWQYSSDFAMRGRPQGDRTLEKPSNASGPTHDAFFARVAWYR
jgi:YD repeat-containing protein